MSDLSDEEIQDFVFNNRDRIQPHLEIHRGKQVQLEARHVMASDEARRDEKISVSPTTFPRPSIIETCSCGRAARVEIQYTDKRGNRQIERSCVVCDMLDRQPRFDN